GTVSFQGEFLSASTAALDDSDPTFTGWYAFGSWFLTGEHRPYKQSSGTFDRPEPASNFDGEGGVGAWELAVRMSRIDLDDGDIAGGRLDDVTVGLNWYLNPNFRWMANYVLADLEDAGSSHALLTRFQTDF
ncbi:MAG TPA: porin, partial [bacterium]|nr:porin [bacterium]